MGSRYAKNRACGRLAVEGYRRIDPGMGNRCGWPEPHLPGHAVAAPVDISTGGTTRTRLVCEQRGATRIIGTPKNGCACTGTASPRRHLVQGPIVAAGSRRAAHPVIAQAH